LTLDESGAPAFAFAQRGLGRVAAFTGEIGGSFGREVVAWPRFSGFFVTVLRWLAGHDAPEDLFATTRREGRDAVISLEVDPDSKSPPDTQQLLARMTDPEGQVRELALERVGENRFEARLALERDGVTLGTLQVGAGRFVPLPPIALPYSPEFERTLDPAAPARLIQRIASESGGVAIASASELWRGPRDSMQWRLAVREFVLAALLLALLEIATRRLELFAFVRAPRGLVLWAQRVRASRSRLRAPAAALGNDAPNAQAGSEPSEASPSVPTPVKPAAVLKPPENATAIALERARRAARQRRDL
jgi:hypothetical protein